MKNQMKKWTPTLAKLVMRHKWSRQWHLFISAMFFLFVTQLFISSMQSQIQKLKDSELTQVLADGFAMLYHNRPQFPVTYLAHYMKNHLESKEQIKNMCDKIAHNSALIQTMEEKEKEEQQAEEVQTTVRQAAEAEQDEFFKEISQAEYHEDLLCQFCEWIEVRYGLTGVYLGELISQKKAVNLDQEDSEEAHIDPEAPKVIKFKHCSNSHHSILKDHTLGLESVTGKLATGTSAVEGEGEPPEGGEEGGQGQPKPKDLLYIPSVVGNQDIHFFKFPRLGSYIGISFKIKSYLSEAVLDANITKTQTHEKLLEEYEKQHEEREAKFKESYEEKAAEGAEEEDLARMEKDYEEENLQFPKPSIEDFEFIERSFVLGADTLGQDQGIPEQTQNKIKDYIEYLKENWEKTELDALKADIDRHLKLQEKIEGGHQEAFLKLLEEEDKQLPGNQEVDKVKENEKLAELEMDTLRIQKLKEYMADEKYESFLDQITSTKVLKYKEVLKYWGLFCGLSKEDINVAGTNLLDLRKARQYLPRESFLEKVTAFVVRGAKPEEVVKPFAKWERMIKNVQGMETQNIAVSNIYIAFILRFLQLAGKVRVADRERRIEVMKEERRLRKERQRQNEQKVKGKQDKIEAAQAEAEQKEEEFDAEAWEIAYNEAEENQLVEVGPAILDEIDGDLENGEETFPEEEDPPAEEEPVEEKAE